MKILTQFISYQSPTQDCTQCFEPKKNWIGHEREKPSIDKEPLHMVCRECFKQNLSFTDEPQCSICFGRITHVNGQPIAEYLNQNTGAAGRQALETRWLDAIQKDARVMLNGRIDCGNKG